MWTAQKSEHIEDLDDLSTFVWCSVLQLQLKQKHKTPAVYFRRAANLQLDIFLAQCII